jgi:hypothetical protein
MLKEAVSTSVEELVLFGGRAEEPLREGWPDAGDAKQEMVRDQLGVDEGKLLVGLFPLLTEALALPKMHDVLHQFPAVEALSFKPAFVEGTLLTIRPIGHDLKSEQELLVSLSVLGHRPMVNDLVDGIAVLVMLAVVADGGSMSHSNDVVDVSSQVLLRAIVQVEAVAGESQHM